MGLSEQDFWELSFKEFDLLRQRRELEEYRAWERTASLMCMVYNMHRGKRQRALKVKDLLKNPFEKKQTAHDAAAFFRNMTIKQGGSINGKQNP
ncbi:hypothetical protein [Candidatus Avelusimicrobium alvi]|uniref:hypothetical protein n=1 Tax=Candidatus Avelusimicrobium alvi TaxID=3416221 RepID=UPI003D0FC980